jgi:transposase
LLIEQVSGEIDDDYGRVVLRVDDVTTYEDAKERLRTFFVEASHRLQLSPAEAAKQFRVGQATFYRWIELSETGRSRRRPRNRSRGSPG